MYPNNMNLLIVFAIPDTSIKFTHWHDGFTKAIEILEKDYTYKISRWNILDKSQKENDLNDYDFILLKTVFGSGLEKKVLSLMKVASRPKLAIAISGSNKIPTDSQLSPYSVLFYETEWYKNYANLSRHSNIIHAFGIDKVTMIPDKNIPKEYDVIFVGNIVNYKRPLNLLKKEGNKIAIGFLTDGKLVEQLEKNGVKCIDFVKYEELSLFYNKSRLCYIPCELHGGGERAVLEARAIGIPVEIENDNTKLKELLESPIYDSYYYAQQLHKGFLLCKENYPITMGKHSLKSSYLYYSY